ncbi:MAG: FAD-binding protein [Rhodobiaceae bacterium]|nr:FAD-binding protein [Rhodobiaceae bacterium]MCC0014128.1 FAD-binding protein [Rhodobiaceae bacterium]MCC0051739.1 FAD-binding protein [Rhodobiaceae bacterium]MCC0060466.1 FAD-binding protein [Rhodobiaceae bacterium]
MVSMARSGSRLDVHTMETLQSEVEGDVMFDAFSRGRYATDASVYQVMPLGVVIPRTFADVEATLAVARAAGVSVLPRGGGTSQCGQTVNESIVIDFSRHLNRVVDVDTDAMTATVEPGIVLDHLNAQLKSRKVWCPVDVSTASRATIGGMTANNSCGSRSIRYGTMRDNVSAIDALMADGSRMRFEDVTRDLGGANDVRAALFRDLLDMGEREAKEIRERFPDIIRRVGGYNIDALVPNGVTNNLAHLLVGSEGTLALSEKITLKLSPTLGGKVLGVCHFPTFHDAMDAAQHLVTLEPTQVELVDDTMIALARDIAMFRPVVEQFVRGDPAALLIVEFAEPEMAENLRRLRALSDLMADLGFRWDDPGKKEGGVVEAIDPDLQAQIINVRKQGLNIMMSMKSAGKPVSFVEDCAVRLPDLAEYTDKLTGIFAKHGTSGTWYAHASVGTLHVRPVLNLKLDTDAKAMRAIAEEAFELVRSYKGSHSGEHGDGIVRSEFHRTMFGDRMVENFEWVKDRLDPAGTLNPCRIVRPPRMDDRDYFRYHGDYRPQDRETVFDWSDYTGASGGLQGAVEMCNNNGACRKIDDGVMCPSYRATRNERDLTRGRANTLRLALSGQLGPDAFTSDEMAGTMKLCVSCKACRRECPTGVDMAKMKIEVLAARAREKRIGLRDALVAFLPRYAPLASRLHWLANLRDRVPALARLSERYAGLSAARTLPQWRRDTFRAPEGAPRPQEADVILFADTFNRYFDPENLAAAVRVLEAAGLEIGYASAPVGRPLCCGRTFLSAGLADEARSEMMRTIEALRPALDRGKPIVGLEPSCIMTFRDEAPAMLPSVWKPEWSQQFLMLEEYLDRMLQDKTISLNLKPLPEKRALLHGHCHQKAFNAVGPVQRLLARVPELQVEMIASSCCGMAGAFGYQAETAEVSLAMGELSLLPKVREADGSTLIVADGTSCRHQIAHGANRKAEHVACILMRALEDHTPGEGASS